MTIHTPFANRPATPWALNFRRPSLSGLRRSSLGDTAGDINQIASNAIQAFRVLHEDEPGMYTVQAPDGSITTYRQPAGATGSLPVGSLIAGTSVTGTVSAGSGALIALGVGLLALAFFSGRGRR